MSFSDGIEVWVSKTLQFNLMQWPYDFLVILLMIMIEDLTFPGQQSPIPLRRNQTIPSDNVVHSKVSLIFYTIIVRIIIALIWQSNKSSIVKNVPSKFCIWNPHISISFHVEFREFGSRIIFEKLRTLDIFMWGKRVDIFWNSMWIRSLNQNRKE